MNKYIKKNGEISIYKYDNKEYHKKYNKKRNKKIDRLQKLKSYYKKIGNIEKKEACQILIDIEKRKINKGVY